MRQLPHPGGADHADDWLRQSASPACGASRCRTRTGPAPRYEAGGEELLLSGSRTVHCPPPVNFPAHRIAG
jgi:hypothetical protein